MGSLLTAPLLLWACGCLAAGERAFLTVGRAATPPALDGRALAASWRSAAGTGGFVVAGGGAVAAPATRAYVTFDDRALYVAFRCTEPDPSRPRGFVRPPGDRAFEDDCVQVFVAPEDILKAPEAKINFGGYQGAYDNWYRDISAYYEFTVNCMGSTTQARNDVRDWAVPWTAAVQRGKGEWTAEIAIPFSALGVTAPKTRTIWGLNLFRMRQPDGCGWVFPGFGGYTPLPLGAICLDPHGGPLARLEPPPPPKPGPNELTFTLLNPTAGPVEMECTVIPTGGPRGAATRTVPTGGQERVSLAYSLAGRGSLRADYAVRLPGEDLPLLSGSLPLARPDPEQLTLSYYALPGLLEGTIHLEEGSTATRLELTCDGGLPTSSADLRGKRGERLRLEVHGKAGDHHQATLRALDVAGNVVARVGREFTIPAKPPWLGTRAGLPLGVLPPYTPMTGSGATVELLGRRVRFGDAGLPESIQSAGEELLAAPMRLVVERDGRELPWRREPVQVLERAEDHVKVAGLWRTDDLRLSVTCNLEYDGFAWVEVKLQPTGAATRVDAVRLEAPLRPDRARYVYEGHAQAAHALSPCGLRRPLSQNLWVGDESRGLAFLAESLEWLQATDRGRQVEISSQGKATLWRSTFLDSPTVLKAPYQAQFALQITPAKPVSLRKSRIYHAAEYGMEERRAGGRLTLPAQGRINVQTGTLEFWARPTFDPKETYDPAKDRSAYNRVLFTVSTGAGQAIILYYNADVRTFRLLLCSGPGQYKLILDAPGSLPGGQWSYVALSWGDKVRLGVNGQASEAAVTGSVTGELAGQILDFNLADFQLDDLRLSKLPHAVERVPAAALTPQADTLLLNPCDDLAGTEGCALVPGRFGQALASSSAESLVDRLAHEGKRIVIFHESWSRYQGYPDLEQIPRLRKIADACHAHGMLFLVYFDQLMSDAAPEWPGLRDDFCVPPGLMWYHRDDVKQDCWVSCVNGPYGDLLLDGIARLADEAGIDGVYMDGTTVPWECGNPTHPGCGEYQGDGTYLPHQTLRATRQFMKRLRNIFAQRRKAFFLDAHTGGCINIATQAFCDGYYDGETLARYKPGFRLSPDAFLTGYMGRQFGFRADFLPNRHTMDQALAICLVHDTATRGQPAAVDLAWAPYEDEQTRYVPYWERSPLVRVMPPQVLGSLYLKPDRALLVLGSQTERTVRCGVSLAGVLARLPQGAAARDAVTGEALPLRDRELSFELPGRMWRMIELKKP